MMKFREKWFWALALAVLVHVGVFLVFYFNTNHADTVEIANSSMNIDQPAAISSTPSAPSDKIYTTTVTSTKTLDNEGSGTDSRDEVVNVDIVNNNGVENSNASKNTANNSKPIITVESEETNSPEVSNSNANVTRQPNTAKQSITTTVEAPQRIRLPAQREQTQRNQALENQVDNTPQSIPPNSENNMEQAKNNAGLLDRDVPTQKSNIKVDKDYLSAKSEVEAVNDQLSAAINEVKKRNQQRIDERQQLRSEANIQDSEIPINQSNQNSRNSE
ncbi:hypothetical protein ACTXGL_11545 [Psychrobacter sp. T6-6]|uniref:hypothetical protein n=1 Tax=Psychrobacter sp. T6-6 TaxID=3457452 RepID=UPI003FD5A70A